MFERFYFKKLAQFALIYDVEVRARLANYTFTDLLKDTRIYTPKHMRNVIT